MTRSNRLILRFSLNRKGAGPAGKWVTRMKAGVRGIVPNLLVRYGDKSYPQIVARLKTEIERDARRELRHLARIYMRTIIGAGYTRSGPAFGGLSTAMAGGPTTSKILNQPWPARSPEYIARKRRKGLTPNWFIAETQTLKAHMGKAALWEEMFGPIRVSIIKKNEAGVSDRAGAAAIKGAADNILGSNNPADAVRLGLLQIKVEALGRVTIPMLTRYSSQSGLIALVAQHDAGLAYRLGGRNPALYRPTLEPFLEFFLTKSLRYAVNQRIQNGLGAKLYGTKASLEYGA